MKLFKKKEKEVKLSYDDENCPYDVKPSELFRINTVGFLYMPWGSRTEGSVRVA